MMYTEPETTTEPWCGMPFCTRTDEHEQHSVEYYIQQVQDMKERAVQLISNYDEAVANLANMRTEFATFKERVRDVARQTAVDMEWCVDGVNQRMRQLGLREFSTLKPRFQLTFKVEFDLEMDADSATDAIWRVRNQFSELIGLTPDSDDEDNIALNSFSVIDSSVDYERVDD